MSAIPGGELCVTEAGDTETQRVTFQTSVAILGYCLPLALIVCLVIGRCVCVIGCNVDLYPRSECQAVCLLLLHHLRLLVLQGGAPAFPPDAAHRHRPAPALHPSPRRQPRHGQH